LGELGSRQDAANGEAGTQELLDRTDTLGDEKRMFFSGFTAA
jgi:hypothetical protein